MHSKCVSMEMEVRLGSGVTEAETLGTQGGQHKKEDGSQLAAGPNATLSSSSRGQQWAAAG